MKNLLFTLSLSFSFLCYSSNSYCALTNSVKKGNSHPTHVSLNGKGVSKILTIKGYKPIQTVNVGDSVVAYLNGGEIVNAVLSVENITPTDRLYYLINGVSMPGTKLLAVNANGNKKKSVQDLAVGDVFYSQNNPVTVATKTADTVNSVHANKDFYLINNKWNLFSEQSLWVNNNVTHAKLLQAGDTIYDDGDAPVIITSVVKNTNLTSWYRFSISGDHSYIVNGLTLHNASRYGSTTGGNMSSTSAWSGSSSGTPNGASVPTYSDDVFLNASSANLTLDADLSVNSFDCTGYTHILTHSSSKTLTVYGATFKLVSAMTYSLGSSTSSVLNFHGGTQNITTAGKALGAVVFNGNSGISTQLQDNLTSLGGIYLQEYGSNGYVFNTNNKNITTPYFDGEGNYMTVNLNASVITCTGNDNNFPYFHTTFRLVNFGEDPFVTVNRGTSKIIFTDASSVSKTFWSPFTLYDLQFTGGGSGDYELMAFHLHQLTDNAATTAHSLLFYGGGVPTTFDLIPIITGSAGNVITIDVWGWYSPATLYCASGTFSGDYLNINNSHATGGAVWNAGNHSTDGGGNTGWIFSTHSITPVIAYGPPGGTPFSTSYEVGSTAGSFAVTQTGGATYNIPLVIPPGTAGMVPNLSVSYNSQAGEGGLLGTGWNLSGLSSISRTGQTLYHDGNIKGVTLDNTDRFVLDGNRLIGYSGPYGSDLAVYGTEIEDFSRITSYGNAGGGPSYFLVETKDGSTLEYGRRSDSRIEPSGVAEGGAVLTWLLNKVTDSRGNYMNIYYDERNATGEYRPFYISYSGNAGAGINPYNEIYFTYGLRQDKQTVYVAGHPVQENVLLTGMEMYAEGVLVHSYGFNYSKNINLHLSEVIEKGSDNKQYNSTKFSYDQSYNLIPQLTQINSPAMDGNMIAVDFNGDGFSDIFRTKNTGTQSTDYMQYINNKDGTFSPSGSSQSLLASYYPMVLNRGKNNTSADLDGNGFDDVLMYKGDTYNLLGQHVTNPSFHALLSNGATLVDGPIFPFNETHGDCKFILGDFDGDGATDLFVYFYDDDKGYIITFRNGGHQTQVLGEGSGNPANGDLGDSNLEFYTTDLNGDGKQEIFYTFNNPWDHTDLFHVLEFTGTWVIETSHGGYPNGWHKIFPGDFNGDGKTDILTWSNAGPTYWNIGYSLGNGLGFDMVPVPSALLPNYGDPTNAAYLHEYIVADFNGDGKSDILDRGFGDGNGKTPSLAILYSTGKSFIMTGRSISDPLSNIGGSSLLGDYNGDGHQEIIYKYGSNSYQALVSFMPGSDVHKVQSITDGLQNTIQINYNTLPILATQLQPQYTRGTGAVYPVNDFQKAMMVVSSTVNDACTQNTDVGGMNYSYEGAKIHLQGKGFLGFTKVKTTDWYQGFVTENTYHTDMDWLSGGFFQPLLSLSKTTTISGQPISEKTVAIYNSINGSDMALPDNSGKRYYMYAHEIDDDDQLHGNFTASTATQNKYGNVVSESSSNNDVSVNSDYTFEAKSAWIPSRLVTSTTTTTRATPSYSRTISFENNGPGGLPSKKIEDTGVTTDYTYNSCGLPETTKVSASGTLPVPLTTLTEYDSKKRFITKQTNPKGHIIQNTYDAGYGNVLTQTDVNALVTSHTYDGFGRIATTTPPSPTPVITISRGWAIDNTTYTCQSYSITTTQSGTATSKQFYDNEGRAIRSETQAFGGSTIFTTRSYNMLGQLTRESEPSSTTLFTNYEYETDFNRLKKVISPGGTTVENTYTYGTNTTQIVTTAGSSVRTVTKTTDASGLLVNSTDEGGDITYLYHSSGNPRSITVNGAAPVTMEYDAFGRQTKLTDPDAGVTTYAYDKLGRIVNQQTAQQAAFNPTYSTTITYDELGRVKTKTDPQEGGITYTYDTTNGKGKISSLSGYGVTSRYTYDNLSRMKSQKETIGGSDYTYNYGYDNLNRVITTGYPSAAGVNTFSVTNVYNTSGYLYQTKKTSDGSLIWQCNTMNERGQVMQSLSGNGLLFTQAYSNLGFLQSQTTNSTIPVTHSYTFDPTTGNLSQRIGHSGVVENFIYDNLDRLSRANHNIPHQTVFDMTTYYDGGGNITNKSDMGDYAYTGPQPHAVYRIGYAGDSLPPQNISYTAFNKVKTISEGPYTADISYGPDQQRTKMVIKNNGATVSTKYYAGNYEKIIAGNVTRELHYAGSAIFVRNTTSGAVKDSMYYIQTDHLGSIVAVFAANGANLARYSYDVWGRRRNYSDLTYTLSPGDTLNRNYFGRFYTGHETISQFGLINMNGRMYDPMVGRMLSPDNYAGSGSSTQTYNRYSYVNNNPLLYVDPNGENPLVIAAVAVGVWSGFANLASNWQNLSGSTLNQVGQATGYFFGGLVSGSIGTALIPEVGPTAAIAISSTIQSLSNHFLNNNSPVVTSLGGLSYNWNSGQVGYLFKPGNSPMENIGYSLGMIANASEAYSAFPRTTGANPAMQNINQSVPDEIQQPQLQIDKMQPVELESSGINSAEEMSGSIPNNTNAEGIKQISNRQFVVAPDGQTIQIPENYYSTPADNGNGIVYRPVGSTNNAYSIRVMGATPNAPNGYVRIYGGDQGLQPLTIFGKPGNQLETHILFGVPK